MGHQQHLARAHDRFAVGIPEAHQAERTEADHLPAQIEEEQVGTVYQRDEAADEDQHGAVEASRGVIMRHVCDGVQEHEGSQACSHQCEEDTQRVHMEDQGERLVPPQQIEVNRPAGLDQAHRAGDGEQRRQRRECSDYPFRARGTQARDEDLQRCAEQERARRDQNERRIVYRRHYSLRRLAEPPATAGWHYLRALCVLGCGKRPATAICRRGAGSLNCRRNSSCFCHAPQRYAEFGTKDITRLLTLPVISITID